MKTHTTNYKNSFIQIADDCPIIIAAQPPLKENKKSIANLQFEMISKHPYTFTSDEILFALFVERNDISKSEMEKAKIDFFSKGQPCFRASPLTKRYGWGVHFDENEKMALYAAESKAYKQFCTNKNTTLIKAMKSKKE
jgi:Family of unknown function (DUF6157)